MPEKPHLQTRGLYFSHATVAQVEYTTQEVRACHDRLFVPVKSVHEGYFGWTPRDIPIQNLDELLPFLVTGHERNHYLQLMSTPCGLLLWRIINSITSGLEYIISKIGQSEAKHTCYLPLQEWFYDNGYHELKKHPPRVPPELAQNLGYEKSAYEQSLPDYLDQIFREIDTLSLFMAAFQNRIPLSMREFVDLANRAFKHLAIRSDLPLEIEWTAHNLNLPHYLPQECFSLTEILEGGARLWEYEVLSAFPLAPGVLNHWQTSSIFGEYKPVFEWLGQEIGDPYLSRIAIDIAMLTPIDLVCKKAVSGKLYVEDVLPGWRLPKIVRSLQDAFWPTDRSEQEAEIRREIAKRADIPTPIEAIQSALQQPFSGPHSWGSDQKLHQVPDEINFEQYFKYTEQEVRRAFEIRKEDSLALVHPEKPDVFQPALEFYKDKAFIHGSPITQHSDTLHLLIYQILIFNLAAIAFIQDGNVSTLLFLQESFGNRMLDYGEEIRQYEKLWDVQTMLTEAYDPALYSLLKWEQ